MYDLHSYKLIIIYSPNHPPREHAIPTQRESKPLFSTHLNQSQLQSTGSHTAGTPLYHPSNQQSCKALDPAAEPVAALPSRSLPVPSDSQLCTISQAWLSLVDSIASQSESTYRTHSNQPSFVCYPPQFIIYTKEDTASTCNLHNRLPKAPTILPLLHQQSQSCYLLNRLYAMKK